MSMQLSEVVAGLREVSPEELAEPWDKVGLQLGRRDQRVKRGLLCIDLTETVVAEAVAGKCQLIVAYHPPIFRPLERVTGDGPWTERRIAAALRAGLAVYSPHTALDAVRGGTNDWLCDGLGAAAGRRPIVSAQRREREQKVVVYVPRDGADRLREAMAGAGAGGIGHYTECSFNLDGTGTFRPVGGARPSIGKHGQLERVAETRVEMICPVSHTAGVLAAIRQVHPYEEPAIDVFDLAEPTGQREAAAGAGRLVELKKPASPRVLADRVKKRLGVARVKVALPVAEPGRRDDSLPQQVRSVAVCVGSGGSLFERCGGADAFVTGEMQHHQVLDLVQRGKAVVLAGHTQTERPYLPTYRRRLADVLPGVEWEVSGADRAPLALR
jgi:dinuclear metal center YbgI/SA1388 family protein